MSRYHCTTVRRRVLIEVVDYAPTSESNTRYTEMLQEDLNAMLKPAAMEVIDVVEVEKMPVEEKGVDAKLALPPVKIPACLPAKPIAGFLPLNSLGAVANTKDLNGDTPDTGDPVG